MMAGLFGFGEPQRDPHGEQVPEGQHLLARVLQRCHDNNTDGAALGQQHRQRLADPPAQVAVRQVGGEERHFVHDHHNQGLDPVRGVLAGDPTQASGPGAKQVGGVVE
jgi:hypothetical protein